jgi:flavin reductase (DIM6/NTAB) family NADH-FMN oxidoreductase RutF
MFYDTDAGDHGLPHNPFKSLVVPRPIGWISTLDGDGRPNLAPFSFFNAVSDNPPVVLFITNGGHVEGGYKDTPANAENTGEFVCNMATWDLREAMNRSSAPLPRARDEFDFAGLTPIPSRMVKPPRVAESPVHLECRYMQTVEIPGHDPVPTKVVFGKVVGIHIDDRFITDGKVDVGAIKPIARMGYQDYTVVERIFSMDRPTIDDVPNLATDRRSA